MAIGEAPEELIPIRCMGSFADPTLEGAKSVDCNFGHFSKEQSKDLDNVIFVVQEGTTYKTGVITARTEHVLRWSVVRSVYYIPNEIL